MPDMTDRELVRSVRQQYGLFRSELAAHLNLPADYLDRAESGRLVLADAVRFALGRLQRRRSLCPGCRGKFPAVAQGCVQHLCPTCTDDRGRSVLLRLTFCEHCYQPLSRKRETCRHCGELAPPRHPGDLPCLIHR